VTVRASSAQNWRNRLTDAWTADSPWLVLLRPLAAVYGTLVGLRAWGYRKGWLQSETPEVLTIVVGNWVAGGGGKTPTVLALVEHLKRQGQRPGIVSRGYGGRQKSPLEVQPHQHRGDEVGDEPLLLAQRSGLPVVVGARRVLAIQTLLAAHPDTTVVVCDDGLQHHALRAHLRIAVFDDRGTGNGRLLPAGPLREPWPRTQAPLIDLVLCSGSAPPSMPDGLAAHRLSRDLAQHARNAFGVTRPLSAWRQQTVCAVAGIAQPHSFFEMLRRAELQPSAVWALPDHANFSEETCQRVMELARHAPVFVTEKDAVKLFPVLKQQQTEQPAAAAAQNVWAVALNVSVDSSFWLALDQKLSFNNGLQTP
jgi:tetraacyldisaccharide 4'-kinase